MFVNLDCIALRTVRYNDRHSILSAYTRQRGRLSMLVPAGSGREASRRRAMLMPGSRFRCVADLREQSGHIPPMRDVVSRGLTLPIDPDPVKPIVTLFLVDFLNTILREAQPDEHLFDYIDTMLQALDGMAPSTTANFHILFLLRLMHFLGIEPDLSTYRPNYLFDMQEGIFRSSAPLHGRYLERDESRAAAQLLRMSLRNLGRYRFTHTERNEIIDTLIKYYTLHFASLRSMKSTEVLRSLFR